MVVVPLCHGRSRASCMMMDGSVPRVHCLVHGPVHVRTTAVQTTVVQLYERTGR
jgi:hypothetical protein